jgi:phage shock protein E
MKLSMTPLIIITTGVAGLVLLAMLVLSSLQTVSAPADGRITPAQYQSQFAGKTHLLVDVRTPEEFSGGHIPGAVNIALDKIEERLSDIPRDEPVVLYCRSGNRSGQAYELLRQAGYTSLYDLGGITAWQAQNLPVIPS